MRIDILTLFPDMVSGALNHSIVGRAIRSGVVDIRVHDLRQWTTDRHRTADDVPFGGGAGMVLKSEPLMQAISDICDGPLTERAERILLPGLLRYRRFSWFAAIMKALTIVSAPQ
jgi:tRNA (guanine-N1)-methyltransferase